MSRQALDELKQQIRLLDYLQGHDWQPARQLSYGRLMGLCPLHADQKPSFLVDTSKGLFYCYGCGRGGDVIRFAELYHQVKFLQAVALLQQWRGLPPLLHETAGFYGMQLHRHGEAAAYLYQRGFRSAELIEHMQIGYAPGGCLRGWLMQLGYPLQTLRQAGLVTGAGYDAYTHRIVFPLEGNLYGRSLSAAAPPHRFLPGAKGGLYLWEQLRQRPFDADTNGSGQQASQSLACRLREQGMEVRRVALPDGHDPNSFFVENGDARQFLSLLEAARP
jgi:DNA primase